MPKLAIPALENLIHGHKSESEITIYKRPHKQAFPGIYSASILPLIEQQISLDDYAMRSLINKTVRCEEIVANLPDEIYQNINSRSDADLL
jgi:molybdopterin-guanine dinucleotide biosynthesis protein A